MGTNGHPELLFLSFTLFLIPVFILLSVSSDAFCGLILGLIHGLWELGTVNAPSFGHWQHASEGLVTY